MEAIQEWMIKHKKTLALAESVTGGQIAAKLTAVPGASRYFLGSIVAYSNDMKKKCLHVPAEILKQKGAVSGEVAKEMAIQLLSITGADYGIAITGIAGPTGGTVQKPIGTMWAAFIEKEHPPFVWNFHLTGSREEIIKESVEYVLNAFYDKIARHINPN